MKHTPAHLTNLAFWALALALYLDDWLTSLHDLVVFGFGFWVLVNIVECIMNDEGEDVPA